MTENSDAATILSAIYRSGEYAARMSDGTELFYRAWLPDAPATKALLLFHRGHEHSGRWQETVEALALGDVAVFAWDARGHGRSPGERGWAPDLARVIKDVDEFVRHISDRHGITLEDMVVLGHSVGAVTVAAWVHDYAPPIRGLILATPAFRVKLYVPMAVPLLRLRQKLLGPGYVQSYVKARMLTHDAEQARRYDADPLISRQIAVNILLDLFDTSTRLLADAGAITVPTLMLVAGSDWVVKPSAHQEFFRKLSSPVKRMEVFPGFYHAVFHEKGREALIEKVQGFIQERFSLLPERPSLLDADKVGYTRQEYDRLRQPGNPGYALTRWGMKTVGRLSRGMQLGCRAGFNSGVTLDYVYENRPRGITPLGRAIDRSYLNSIGWRGIRQRRDPPGAPAQGDHRADARRGPSGPPAGHRLGAWSLRPPDDPRPRPHPHHGGPARLQGREPRGPRRLTAELGVSGVTIAQGDAFDRTSLATVAPRPTIAIVSGLFELFPDNEPVLRSLRGLADAVEPGGHLIYTNQPWHPQVEFIARVLTNREGQPWIMRRRSQAEMDELVQTAGFTKLSQEIDPWGIFTVSLARRVGA